MPEKVSREDLASALRAYLEARSAVNAFLREDFAWFWPESQKSPPEPKPWTQEAWEEWENLKTIEQQAYEEWERLSRAFLAGS